MSRKPPTIAKPGSSPMPAASGFKAPAAQPGTVENKSGASTGQVSHDAIAKAAYLRWLKNGGTSESNWLAAEKELRSGSRL